MSQTVTNKQRAKIKALFSEVDPDWQSLKWAGNALMGRRPRASKWETVLTASQVKAAVDDLPRLEADARDFVALRDNEPTPELEERIAELMQ